MALSRFVVTARTTVAAGAATGGSWGTASTPATAWSELWPVTYLPGQVVYADSTPAGTTPRACCTRRSARPTSGPTSRAPTTGAGPRWRISRAQTAPPDAVQRGRISQCLHSSLGFDHLDSVGVGLNLDHEIEVFGSALWRRRNDPHVLARIGPEVGHTSRLGVKPFLNGFTDQLRRTHATPRSFGEQLFSHGGGEPRRDHLSACWPALDQFCLFPPLAVILAVRKDLIGGPLTISHGQLRSHQARSVAVARRPVIVRHSPCSVSSSRMKIAKNSPLPSGPTI